MMSKLIQSPGDKVRYLLAAIFISLSCSVVSEEAASMTEDSLFNIEELRLEKASEALGLTISQHTVLSKAKQSLNAESPHFSSKVKNYAQALWFVERKILQASDELDDRPLYWHRLGMRRMVKSAKQFQALDAEAQAELLWQLELISRGSRDIIFKRDVDLKILVTGFDPFFLDREIKQSNPSGAAAMALDGRVINYQDISAQIEALVVPVRYGDFDQGMIETLLKPYYDKVDMIATISMGRSDFDLERFPGLRRSVGAPDNLNVYTGASAENPIIPQLFGKEWSGPEFVEFSLPVAAMIEATGVYNINDNREVTTLSGQKQPNSLSELDVETAVRGGGGGYLSNEISYRSIRLRNELNPDLPVGHIHTPRITAFDPQATTDIVAQIEQMIILALPVLADKASQ